MKVVRNPDARIVVCVGASSLLVNLVLVAWRGIVLGGDSFRYVNGADALLTGQPFQPYVSQYLGYVGVVALARLAGTGLAGVVAVQFAVAALAAVALYDLGRQLSGRVAGLAAAGAFILNPDISQWHRYILTDSLYLSIVALATWCIHRAAEHGAASYLVAAGAGAAAAAVRPNGWIFGPLAGVYWIARSTLGKWTRVAIAGGSLAALAGVVSVVLYQRYGDAVSRPSSEWDNMRAFADVWLGSLGYGPSEDRFSQAVTRVATELGHTRPGFSLRHNAAIVAMLAVIYPLAIAGFIATRREPLARLMLAVIGGHLLIVALTFADRDGRYLMYVFPLIGVFAAAGATPAAAIVSSRRRSPDPRPR